MPTFDGPNKLIILAPGTISITAVGIYSDWKEWSLLGNNLQWAKAFTVIGNEPISATNNTPSFFFLENGWRIRPQEADHTLTVDGNLVVSGGLDDPFVPTLGDFNVQIQSNVSTSPIAVVDGLITAQEIRDAMALALSNDVTPELGSIDKKIQQAKNAALS